MRISLSCKFFFLYNFFPVIKTSCFSDYHQESDDVFVVFVKSMASDNAKYTVKVFSPKTRGKGKTAPIKRFMYSCTCLAMSHNTKCKHIGAVLILYFTSVISV